MENSLKKELLQLLTVPQIDLSCGAVLAVQGTCVRRSLKVSERLSTFVQSLPMGS